MYNDIFLGNDGVISGRLLLFDGEKSTFRNVKLRGKISNCNICSMNPSITELVDYEQFCGSQASDKDLKLKILESNERISVHDYKNLLDNQVPHLLIDVRSRNEYEICRLESSINIPVSDILDENRSKDICNRIFQKDLPIYVVCRRGNDSQRVVKHLKTNMAGLESQDLIGGLHEWSRAIDPQFPVY